MRRIAIIACALILFSSCSWPIFGPYDRYINLTPDNRFVSLQWILLFLAALTVFLNMYNEWLRTRENLEVLSKGRQFAENILNKAQEESQATTPLQPGFLNLILPMQGSLIDRLRSRVKLAGARFTLFFFPAQPQQGFLTSHVIIFFVCLLSAYSIAGTTVYYYFSSLLGIGEAGVVLALLLGLVLGTLLTSTSNIVYSLVLFYVNANILYALFLYYIYKDTQILFFWLMPVTFTSLLRVLFQLSSVTSTSGVQPVENTQEADLEF